MLVRQKQWLLLLYHQNKICVDCKWYSAQITTSKLHMILARAKYSGSSRLHSCKHLAFLPFVRSAATALTAENAVLCSSPHLSHVTAAS